MALSARRYAGSLVRQPSFNPDPDQPRFSTNKPSFFLQSWRITGMRQLLRILENPKVKKCPLADATSLVKIITICAHLGSDFQVYIYHGDERQLRSGTHKKIAGKLTRRHPIFNGEEKNSRVIVITTLVTLRNRHGPSALKTFRLTKKNFTDQQAKDHQTINDPEWEFNLAGLFEHLTVDEAHTLKNANTMAHTAVSWLDPRIQILATAIVLSNRIDLAIFSSASTICIAVALSEKLL
ncbi:hypothetical protein BTUL_0178g00040 [Botrytis tulipae]|uniref:SNF2 N-terminal domain-containing protein n=1 Tax=Botrytis tulipae TaxID=87230 RepID=A0A4Z1EFC0_9HELO|nr:hypothetical protein BTUL_0178g00040 [Botrytis tulipae]